MDQDIDYFRHTLEGSTNYELSTFCKNVGIKRVKELALALQENDTVQWLDLRHNPLQAEGAQAVASALERHPSIERLE